MKRTKKEIITEIQEAAHGIDYYENQIHKLLDELQPSDYILDKYDIRWIAESYGKQNRILFL